MATRSISASQNSQAFEQLEEKLRRAHCIIGFIRERLEDDDEQACLFGTIQTAEDLVGDVVTELCEVGKALP